MHCSEWFSSLFSIPGEWFQTSTMHSNLFLFNPCIDLQMAGSSSGSAAKAASTQQHRLGIILRMKDAWNHPRGEAGTNHVHGRRGLRWMAAEHSARERAFTNELLRLNEQTVVIPRSSREGGILYPMTVSPAHGIIF